MELLLVFVAGTLFGLFLCLFCDWRSKRRQGWYRPAGTPSKAVSKEEGDSIQQSAVDSDRPDNWKDAASDGDIEDPRTLVSGIHSGAHINHDD